MIGNKKTLGIIVSVIIAAAVLLLLWSQGWLGNSSRRLYQLVKNDPARLSLYNQAMNKEAQFREKPDDAAAYVSAGLFWKSLGEQSQSHQKEFFARSLATYEKGIERFGDKNILFYINAGNVAVRLEEFLKAESYFRRAIEVSSADESGYAGLVDLYYYNLHKSKEEVLAAIEPGFKSMVDPTPLLSIRATYLRRVGDYAAALVDYKKLVLAFPSAIGYKQIVVELEQLLKQPK